MSHFISKEFFKASFLRIRKYGIWLLVNFVLSAIPFAAMFAMNYPHHTLFSNFLVFNFALLISSLYVLFVIIDSHIETNNQPTILLIFTILWIIFIMLTFVLYPDIPHKGLASFFAGYLAEIALFVLLITAIISLFLNRPTIKQSIMDQIEAQKANQKIDDSQKTKDKAKQWKKELEGDIL